jgi:hypothetical protein
VGLRDFSVLGQVGKLRNVGRKRDWRDLREIITTSPYYASLKPELSPEAIKMIEADRTAYVGEDVFLKLFTNEIGRIERKWKLV